MAGVKVEEELFSKIITSSIGWAEAHNRLKEIGLSDLRNIRRRCERLGIKPLSGNKEASDLQPFDREYLVRRLNEVQKENRELIEKAADISKLKFIIHEALEREPDPPKFLSEKVSSKTPTLGVPLLELSDIHWGENVYKSQINGVNEYNKVIATERINRIFDKSTFICKKVLKSVYPGIIVTMLGDQFSGYIHEELRENAWSPISVCVFELLDLVISGIDYLKQEFGSVFIPCVVGNHSRLDKKIRYKWGVHDNWEWLFYHILKRHYKDDPDVTIRITDSSDDYFKVFQVRFMITHGNQFRGGGGWLGQEGPIARGDQKKRARQQAIQQPYDTLLLGHWHVPATSPNYTSITNGSIKGYDEYAFNNNYKFCRPSQNLVFVHHEHGIICTWAVFADKPVKNQEVDWISLPS